MFEPLPKYPLEEIQQDIATLTKDQLINKYAYSIIAEMYRRNKDSLATRRIDYVFWEGEKGKCPGGCGSTVIPQKAICVVGEKVGEVWEENNGCNCNVLKEAMEFEKKMNEEIRIRSIERQHKKFQKDSYINRVLQQATFETFKTPTSELAEIKEKMMCFAEGFSLDSNNIILAGTYGTGKSHLCVSICKKVIDLGYTALFISSPKMLTKIKDSYSKSSSFSESEFINYIQSVDLLVIDDIGSEHFKEDADGESWGKSKLFEILDERQGKPTIYTTNLTSQALETHVGQRNYSRILYNAKAYKLQGVDYRRKSF